MFNLKDKVCLITGATGGIGEAIASAFTAQGATVIITGRNLEKLEEQRAKSKEQVIAIQADLSKKG